MADYNEYEWAENATDEQLTRWIEDRKHDIAEMNNNINRLEATCTAYQAILDRRAIDKLWSDNPKLLRVNVDDKLWITDEFTFNRIKRGGIDIWKDTDTIKVASINPKDMGCAIDGYLDGRAIVNVGFIPMQVVSTMRRAYLESETYAT